MAVTGARLLPRGRSWLLVGALALTGCARADESQIPCRLQDVLGAAREYYVAHVPRERLNRAGGKLAYFVEDEGDRWFVMVSPARELKLNVQMMIRKNDLKVSSVPTPP